MTTKRIHAWQATAALTSDEASLTFQFTDKTSYKTPAIPSARLAGIIAILESSSGAAYTVTDDGQHLITNAPNTPGD